MKFDIETVSKLRLPPNWRNLLLDLPNQPGFSKIPTILTVVMLIAFTASLAEFTWMIFSVTPDASSIRPSRLLTRPGQANNQAVRLSSVANLHLFGQAPNKPIDNLGKELNAPKTSLRLTLKGLLATGNTESAIAIIADDKGKEKHYITGAALPGNAKLHTIYDNRIILARAGGQLETLFLPKIKLPKDSVVRQAARPRSRQVRAGSSLKTMRDDLIKNPQNVWKDIRIEPKMSKSGGIQGYTLSHKDKKLMNSLGIRKTDIITSVNGMPLNDPTSLYQILDVLKTTQQLNLSIIRNGTEETLNIDMM